MALIDPFEALIFAGSYGDFLMSTYCEHWAHLTDVRGVTFTRKRPVTRIFTIDIGKASTNYRILVRLLNKMILSNFNILSFFFEKSHASALLYVKEHARNVLRMEGGSFFLLCAFVGQVSVLSAKKNYRHLAHLPLLALSDILYEEKLITLHNYENIQDIATVINAEFEEIEQSNRVTRYQPNPPQTSAFFLQQLYILWTGENNSSSNCEFYMDPITYWKDLQDS